LQGTGVAGLRVLPGCWGGASSPTLSAVAWSAWRRRGQAPWGSPAAPSARRRMTRPSS